LKKKLLISGSSRSFVQDFGSIITELSTEFRIVVVLIVLKGVQAPRKLNSLINEWEADGVVEKCFLMPDPKDWLKFNLRMWRLVSRLKAYDFDLWLTRSDMQPSERYICDYVLPNRSIRIVMSFSMTYVFQRHQTFARKILLGVDNIIPEPQIENPTLSKLKLAEVILRKLRQEPPLKILRKLWVYLSSHTKTQITSVQSYLIGRVIFPWLITGKTFRYGPFDQMTQMSSGRSDAYIMSDEVEVETHKRLFKTSNVFLARYPTLDNCRCDKGVREQTTVLCPLSGWEGLDSIPEEVLALYYRDLQTVLIRTGASKFHLRTHPDFKTNGGWGIQLQAYLGRYGIASEVVGSERPITEIVCDYMGVVGFASTALRDVRAHCNFAFVVGLVGVSKFYFNDPRFIFGKSEGIGWIEADGSFDPDILARRKYVSTDRKEVSEIVVRLSRMERDSLH
jgi:hypothetical protein